MKLVTSDTLVIVSRVGYDLLVRDNVLITPLQGKKLVFINSTRTSHLPPKDKFAELHLIELRDCNEYLTSLVKSIMSRHQVSQILTISEQDLTPVVFARNSLGFPGLSINSANLFRDKVAMKRALKESNLNLPSYASGDDDEEMTALFVKFGKIVVKPRDGYGSQDTSVIDDAQQLEAFIYRPKSFRSGYLAEAFVGGEVYHLDAVVRNSKILFSSLGKYIVAPLQFTGRRWAGTKFTNTSTDLHSKAKLDLLELLRTFKISDGVFHFEFFFDGIKNVFGEVAIRPAGGGIADAIYDAFGVHLVEEHVRIQLGMKTSLNDSEIDARYGASLLMLSEANGLIDRYDGLQKTELDSLKRINYHYKAGDNVSMTRYSADSLLTLSLASSDTLALDADIAHVCDHGRVILA